MGLQPLPLLLPLLPRQLLPIPLPHHPHQRMPVVSSFSIIVSVPMLIRSFNRILKCSCTGHTSIRCLHHGRRRCSATAGRWGCRSRKCCSSPRWWRGAHGGRRSIHVWERAAATEVRFRPRQSLNMEDRRIDFQSVLHKRRLSKPTLESMLIRETLQRVVLPASVTTSCLLCSRMEADS